ncbi:MAG: hypothetical protein KAU10_09870, partial [Dehalococcoidia bacterium]|nr:hypothetical protein [Dehalococcoidia bacterium]
DQATAMASILPRPPQITVSAFFDENADGSRDEGELGMPELPVLLDSKVTKMTLADGTVTFTDLDPGSHTITIPQEGIQAIEGRGYGLEEVSQTVRVEPGESAILFFALQKVIGKVKGSVFVDENGNGTYEEGEPTVALVTVQLDGKSRVTTDESGQFLFLHVQPGEHELLVADESGRSMTLSFVLSPGEELVLPVAWPKEARGFLKVQIGGGG